ncbi:MFS transporter [candidate division WWE3 bacterium]|jgi:hypothetical protein|nr:MFS transporter [candidate division WWE3 bacterium]MBT7349984.1 MFS transporter [candidate division WWE3 bacterium]
MAFHAKESHRFSIVKNISKPTNILIFTDSIFFSGMAIVDVVFGVFIVQQVPNATVASLGTGAALYTLGILITEPIFASLYNKDTKGNKAFYGYITGNFIKTLLRLAFIMINSVTAFYIIYFLHGIAHSIAFPSFSKVFTQSISKGNESLAWGYKDFMLSLGKIITLFTSGYIVLAFGYQLLFLISASILFLSGVIYPLLKRKYFLNHSSS